MKKTRLVLLLTAGMLLAACGQRSVTPASSTKPDESSTPAPEPSSEPAGDSSQQGGGGQDSSQQGGGGQSSSQQGGGQDSSQQGGGGQSSSQQGGGQSSSQQGGGQDSSQQGGGGQSSSQQGGGQDSSQQGQDSSQQTPTHPYHTWKVVGEGAAYGNWVYADSTAAFTYTEANFTHGITLEVAADATFKLVADSYETGTLSWQIVKKFNNKELIDEADDTFGGVNIKVKKAGTLAITIDDDIDLSAQAAEADVLSDITVSFTPAQDPQPTKPLHTWQMVGEPDALGHWVTENAKAFTYNEETDKHTITVTLAAGDLFKAITDRTWRSPEHPNQPELSKELVDKLNDKTAIDVETNAQGTPTGNVKAIKAGDLTVTIDDDIDVKTDGTTDLSKIAVSFTPAQGGGEGGEGGGGEQQTVADGYYLYDSVHGWDIDKGTANQKPEESDDIAQFFSVALAKDQMFKFIPVKDGALDYPNEVNGTKLTGGTAKEQFVNVSEDHDNFKALVTGTFDFYINSSKEVYVNFSPIKLDFTSSKAQNAEKQTLETDAYTLDNKVAQSKITYDAVYDNTYTNIYAHLPSVPEGANRFFFQLKNNHATDNVHIDVALGKGGESFTSAIIEVDGVTDYAYYDTYAGNNRAQFNFAAGTERGYVIALNPEIEIDGLMIFINSGYNEHANAEHTNGNLEINNAGFFKA